MRPALPEVDLGGDEGVVHDVEDVGVVGLEEGDHLSGVGVVLQGTHCKTLVSHIHSVFL